MAYKKYNEFVAERDAQNEVLTPPNPIQAAQNANNPAMRQNVQSTLKAAVNAPPPPGANPTMYRTKLNQAMNVAKNTAVPTPKAAMDIVNTQQAAMQ